MTLNFKEAKHYKKLNNKELVEKFAYYILGLMGTDEIKRYRKEFRLVLDFNIYQYGNLDVYDYDLYKTLYHLGLRTKPVINYHNNLDVMPFPYKCREDIRKCYMALVRYAVYYMEDNKLI